LGNNSVLTPDQYSSSLLALADVACKFQYNPRHILQPDEHQQFISFRLNAADINSLWCYSVIAFIPLQRIVPLKSYCVRSWNHNLLYGSILDGEYAGQLRDQLRVPDGGVLPDWAQDVSNALLVLSLSGEVMDNILHNNRCSFLIPSPYAGKPYKTPAAILKNIPLQLIQDFKQAKANSDQLSPWPAQEPMTMEETSLLADDLRRVVLAHPEMENPLAGWIMKLDAADSEAIHHQHFRKRGPEDMIRYLIISDMLKNTSILHTVLLHAIDLLLPTSMAQSVKARVENSCEKAPDKGQISRARFSMDVTMMVWRRCLNYLSSQSQTKLFARYMCWDSSPQYHRDYVMIIVRSVLRANLRTFLAYARELQRLWVGVDFDDEDECFVIAKREAFLMEFISSCIHDHALPAVQVGFGNSSFPHKYGALGHAIHLEHWTASSFARWVDEFVSGMADYGVERMLSKASACPVREVCPYFTDATSLDIEHVIEKVRGSLEGYLGTAIGDVVPAEVFEEASAHSESVGAEGGFGVPDEVFEECVEGGVPLDEVGRLEEFEDCPEEPQSDFSKILDLPAMHHLIDNATEGLDKCMEFFDSFIHGCMCICKLVRRYDLQEKLLERCFSTLLAQMFHSKIYAFRGHVYRKRWGTISFSMPQILELEITLRRFWNLDEFLGASTDVPETVEGADTHIRNPFFWAWLHMFEMFCSILRKLTGWVDSCDCHWQLIQDGVDVPGRIMQQWVKCPLRNMRAAALSAGEFMDLLKEFVNSSTALLMINMPTDIDTEQKTTLLQEFTAGTSHLIFISR
jgi:hypothetical protein